MSEKKTQTLSIVHINTDSHIGGATKVSQRLMDAQIGAGHQAEMIVGTKHKEAPHVCGFDKKPDPFMVNRFRRKGWLDYEYRGSHDLIDHDRIKRARIIHFHNLHGGYFNPFSLALLSNAKPSIWTLHDMQSLTGHCAHAFECDEWERGCGTCRFLTIYPAVAQDGCGLLFQHKKWIYDLSDLCIVVPSQWLETKVRKSLLKDHPVHLIYNGVDTDLFRPRDKSALRDKLGLPRDAFIFGSAANGGIFNNFFKGGKFAAEAVRSFTAKEKTSLFLNIGARNPSHIPQVVDIPWIDDEHRFAQILSVSDAFLFTSIAENCPLVVLEAMSTGIPVVAFQVGGVPELVRDQKEGFLAETGDTGSIISALNRLSGDRSLLRAMGEDARNRALDAFDHTVIAAKYEQLYQDRLTQWEKSGPRAVPQYEPPEILSLKTFDGYLSKLERVHQTGNDIRNDPTRASFSDSQAIKTVSINHTEPNGRRQREVKSKPPNGYLVSALVSTYNSERFIRGCLDDLLSQTIADQIEIIVIDSRSEENEKIIVRAYQEKHDNIIYMRTEKRESLYAAWNRGIRAARGTYITNANTDDRHLHYTLEVQARALDRFPEVGMVYGDVWGTEVENDVVEPEGAERYRPYRYPDFTLINGLQGSNFSPQPMWRKSVHDQVGYFDESYTIAGDYEFFFRLAKETGALHIRDFLGLYYENQKGIEKSQPEQTAREFSSLRNRFYSQITLHEFFPLLSEYPDDPEARAAALWALGNNCLTATVMPEFSSAFNYYRQVMEMTGPSSELITYMATAKIGSGERAEGMAMLERAAKDNADAADLYRSFLFCGTQSSKTAKVDVQIKHPDHPVVSHARKGKQLRVTDLLSPVPIQSDGEKPLVSAVVSTYNAERFIRGCLEDLSAQTIADRMEIIVVDGGSEQNESAVVKEFQKKYSNILYLRSDRRITVYGAWNLGIKAAMGRYVTNANTDDRHRKDAFEIMAAVLQSRPDIALVYADQWKTSGENETFEEHLSSGRFQWRDWNRQELLEKGCFIGPQPMWRKDVHEHYGYFDESFVTSGDYEFWLRISQTLDFYHIPECLGLYLESETSLEKTNREKQQQENERIYKMYNRRNYPGEAKRIDEPKEVLSINRPEKANEEKKKKSDKKTMVSIMLLLSGSLSRQRQTIESIRRHTTVPYELILMETDESSHDSESLKAVMKPGDRYAARGETQTVSRRINSEARNALGDHMVVITDNVVAASGWVEGMIDSVRYSTESILSGPMTVPSPETAGLGDRFESIEDFDACATAFGKQYRHRRIDKNHLSGSFVLVNKDVFDGLGRFDDRYQTADMMMQDFCLKAALQGYGAVTAGDVLVYRPDDGSTVEDEQKKSDRLKKDRDYFNEKWGAVDGGTQRGKRYIALNALREGEALCRKGKLNEAVDAILQGMRYAPDEKMLSYGLVEMLIGERHFDEAADLLEKTARHHDDVKRLEYLGICREGMGDDLLAEQAADRVLAVNNESATALNLKGVLAYKRKAFDEARDFFNQAVRVDPSRGGPYKNLGVMEWDQKSDSTALDFFEKGFLLSPHMTEVATAYHSAVTALGSFERAESLFDQAAALYPFNDRIRFLLIDVYLKQGKYDQAMSAIEDALIRFEANHQMLDAAIAVRDVIGPMKIDKTQKDKDTISLCMIVKDEADDLAGCLKSIKPLVDEIIVVDTGSTDLTKKIARSFGAEVYDFPWVHDYSKARNHSISKASGDWILVIDADEVISPQDHDFLRKEIDQGKKKKAWAYSIVTRNYTMLANTLGWTANDGKYAEEEGGLGWIPSEKVRLFRNDGRIRFEYPVHEVVEPVLKRNNINVDRCSVPIHHYGKLNKKKNDAKSDVYYQIGRKKLNEHGDNPVALKELAVQAGLLEKWEEALDLWRRFLTVGGETPQAYTNMSTALGKLGKYEEALLAAKKAVELAPELKEGHYNYAVCQLHLGRSDRAVSVLRSLTDTFPQYLPALFILAAAYCCNGQTREGIKGLKKIQNTPMGSGIAITCHELGESLMNAGRTDDALAFLSVAIENNYINKDILSLFSKCLDHKRIHNEKNRLSSQSNHHPCPAGFEPN